MGECLSCSEAGQQCSLLSLSPARPAAAVTEGLSRTIYPLLEEDGPFEF